MTAKSAASSIESFKAQDNHTITQVTTEATAEEEEREEEVSQYNEDVEDHYPLNDTLPVQLASKSEGKDEHDSKTDKADEASVTLSEKEEVAATAPTSIPAPTPPASVFATPSASVYGTPSGSRVASPDKLAACLVSISQRKEMLAKQQSSRSINANVLPPPSTNTTRNLLSEKLRSKFGGGNPCAACHKNVYKVEELLALNQTWHKSCFRCGEIG